MTHEKTAIWIWEVLGLWMVTIHFTFQCYLPKITLQSFCYSEVRDVLVTLLGSIRDVVSHDMHAHIYTLQYTLVLTLQSLKKLSYKRFASSIGLKSSQILHQKCVWLRGKVVTLFVLESFEHNPTFKNLRKKEIATYVVKLHNKINYVLKHHKLCAIVLKHHNFFEP